MPTGTFQHAETETKIGGVRFQTETRLPETRFRNPETSVGRLRTSDY